MLTASPQIHAPADEPVDQSVLENRAQSVGHLFRDRVTATPDRAAFQYAVVRPAGDEWLTVTWAELDVVVREIAAGLVALGVEPEQRVAIASGTRYEWVLADLAVMCAGGGDDDHLSLDDPPRTSRSSSPTPSTQVVFAEDDEQIAKLRAHRADTPDVRKVVAVRRDARTSDAWVITLDELRAAGPRVPRRGTRRRRRPDRRDPARAARHADLHLGHDGPAQGRAAARTTPGPTRRAAIDALGILAAGRPAVPVAAAGARRSARCCSTLPLQIGFPTAIDGRVDKIVDNLAVVQADVHGRGAAHLREGVRPDRPRPMAGEGGRQGEDLRLGQSASGRAGRELRASRARTRRACWPRKYAIADKLVFTKVRERFGGRLRFFISGSAALSPATSREWFHAVGILILEGYGLTETSAASFVNRPTAYRSAPSGCRCRAPRSRSPRTARSCSRARA